MPDIRPRYRFRQVIRDANGTILPNKSVELRNPGTTEKIKTALFANNTAGTLLTQPLISDNQGVIQCYVENGRVADLYVVDDELTVTDMIVGTRPSSPGGSWSWHVGRDGAPGTTISQAANTTYYYLVDRFPVGYCSQRMVRLNETWSLDTKVRHDAGVDVTGVTIRFAWYLNDQTWTDNSFPLLSTDYTSSKRGPANAFGEITVSTAAAGAWVEAESTSAGNITYGHNNTPSTYTFANFPKSVALPASASKTEPCYVELVLKVTTPSTGSWDGYVEFKNVHISSTWAGL